MPIIFANVSKSKEKQRRISEVRNMEFSKLIEERRSVRAYKAGVTIDKNDIEQMIYAAQQAPSWKNSQTGRYYAAISKEMVSKVRSCLPSFNFDRTENACAYIVTAFKCGISGFTPDGTPTDAHQNGWGAYDLGLQNQNLLLKARELGYDTLIMGLRKETELRAMLGIKDDELIMSVIAIGKRAIDPQKPDRKQIDEILKIF